MRNDKEYYDPDELAVISISFDDACKMLTLTQEEGPRLELAAIMLQLNGLAQLGPRQLKATAARLFRERCRKGEPV